MRRLAVWPRQVTARATRARVACLRLGKEARSGAPGLVERPPAAGERPEDGRRFGVIRADSGWLGVVSLVPARQISGSRVGGRDLSRLIQRRWARGGAGAAGAAPAGWALADAEYLVPQGQNFRQAGRSLLCLRPHGNRRSSIAAGGVLEFLPVAVVVPKDFKCPCRLVRWERFCISGCFSGWGNHRGDAEFTQCGFRALPLKESLTWHLVP
jgi:hypothetical protein